MRGLFCFLPGELGHRNLDHGVRVCHTVHGILVLLALSLDTGRLPLASGAEALASVNVDGGDMRCEPSVGIHGDSVLVSWNDSYGGAHGSPTGTAAAWSYSSDRGKNYIFGGYLSSPEHGFGGADTRISVSPSGDFYLLNLQWGKAEHALRLYSAQANNLASLREVGVPIRGTFIDKPAMTVTQRGRIVVAYTGDRTIKTVLSDDKGRTWSQPRTVSEESKTTRLGCAVASKGQELFVAWMQGEKQLEEVWLAHSPDGQSFQPPRKIYTLSSTPRSPKGYTMAGFPDGEYALPCWDVGLVTTSSEVFVVAAEGRENGSLPIVLVSKDSGKTFGPPIPLGGPDPTGFHAMPTALNYKGRLALMHYHQPASGSAALSDVILTTLGKDSTYSLRLNSEASDWLKVEGDKAHAPIQRTFGDYVSLAADAFGNLIAAWTDGRTGKARIMTKKLDPMPIPTRFDLPQGSGR